MNSGLYEIPGFSATCMAAARASWLALPVTKLSNENARFRRPRSRIVGTSLAPRCIGCGARTGLRRKRPDPGIELLRGEFLLESTQAGVPEVLHLMVGRGELEFYLLRYELSTAASALNRQAQTI